MAASAAVILVLTLTPHPGAITVPPGFCILCGSFGTANLIRNVVLFVPFGIGAGMVVGVGLGMRGGPVSRVGAAPGAPVGGADAERPGGEWARRFLRGWLPAVGLTAGIELTQNFLPGRNPLLVDFVANAAGAAVGMLLVGSFVRSARGPNRRGLLRSVGWWGVSAAALAGTALAFRIAPPPPPHFVQIQADLAQFERYAGEVNAVWLQGAEAPAGPRGAEVAEATSGSDPRGRERLEIGRYPDPEALLARIFGGSRVVVAFEAGPPPARIAPLFSLYTGEQREAFLLGIQGNDAVVRLPYLAATLLLDHPDHRIPGALAEMGPGDEAELSFWRSGEGSAGTADGSACLQLVVRSGGAREATDPAQPCGLRPTMGEGWTLLLFPSSFSPRLQAAMSWAWLLGLGFVPGLFSHARRGAGLAGVGLALVGGAAPLVLGSTAILTVGQGLALVGGALLGWWGRSGLVACLTPSVPAGPSHPRS